MSNNNLSSDSNSKQIQKVVHQTNIGERVLLVRGALCLSVLGVIAFLITGQVAVVVAMNAPLLAIIGKDYFLR